MSKSQVDDIFQRAPFATSLIDLIKNTQTPNSFGLNAVWGSGKTTFIENFLVPAANKENIPVVVFDCFENERAGDPFYSIIQLILTRLAPSQVPQTKTALEGVAGKAKAVAIGTGKVIVNAALKTIVRQNLAEIIDNYTPEDFANGAAEDITTKMAEFVASKLQSGLEEKRIVEDFKTSVAELVTGYSDSKRLLIVFDELDRCRPSYALDVLEAAKHYLDIKGLVFLYSYHRTQICGLIRHEFGESVDANTYLHKFVRIDFQLPQSRIKASAAAFTKLLNQYAGPFENTGKFDDSFEHVLSSLNEVYDFSPRTVEKIITLYALTKAPIFDYSITILLTVLAVKWPSHLHEIYMGHKLSKQAFEDMFIEKVYSALHMREAYRNDPPAANMFSALFEGSGLAEQEQKNHFDKLQRFVIRLLDCL